VKRLGATRSPGPLAPEVRRLWLLAAMQGLAHAQGPEPVSFAQIIGAAERSTPRADSPLENCWVRYLDALDEATVRAAGRVISACEAKAKGSRIGRIKASMQALMATSDEQRRATRVCPVQLLHPAPTQLSVWELPPGEAGAPYRHRVGEAQLILVLDGRPTLHTRGARRELQVGEAVALGGDEDVDHELVNVTHDSVRFLALSASGQASLMI
jgi:quercetin dioxygenase-like cupin family protein